DRLKELDLDQEPDYCEKLHEDAERLYRSQSARLKEQQDGASWRRCGYDRSNTGIALIFIVLALNIITPVIPR
ncbi:Rop family plasmid primer RNA-binding protein, partial [Klebsiella pneumoniae]|uniref:Rop family plasmid primer RNA-binding protein n=1 Tax=Klebsiella pneumoniae TaxID=573 RepID=UPI0023814A46